MGLRLQINLIMGVLLAAFASLLIYLQLDNTRQSVREEMQGASIVATQLLSRLQAGSRNSSLEDMAQFLDTVGRVRANDIGLPLATTCLQSWTRCPRLVHSHCFALGADPRNTCL